MLSLCVWDAAGVHLLGAAQSGVRGVGFTGHFPPMSDIFARPAGVQGHRGVIGRSCDLTPKTHWNDNGIPSRSLHTKSKPLLLDEEVKVNSSEANIPFFVTGWAVKEGKAYWAEEWSPESSSSSAPSSSLTVSIPSSSYSVRQSDSSAERKDLAETLRSDFIVQWHPPPQFRQHQ